MKKLDQAALDFAVKKEKEGVTRLQITEELKNLGYTTKTGQELTGSALSEFMIEHGHQKHQRRTLPKEDAGITLTDALSEVMNSNMTPEAKILIVRNVKK